MNAIDILGSLLGGGKSGSQSNTTQGRGHSSSSGGLGGTILDELLKSAGGGSGASSGSTNRSAGRATAQPAGQSSSGGYSSSGPIDIDREARSLEEMLGVASGRSSSPAPSPSAPSTYRPAPSPGYQGSTNTSGPAPNQTPQPPANSAMTANDEAVILIQALINAAKADGRIDANEQQSILSQVPNDPTTINFLKQQFAQPLDVREFAWSVPLGMEVKVYTMSLAGMQLDNQAEADYLIQLAHGLRLPPDTCRQIHARYGAADIF